MRRIQIHTLKGIDIGMELLTKELRRQGISEDRVITVGRCSEAVFFFAYIREGDDEELSKQLREANTLLHRVSMTLSSGQAVKPSNMEYSFIRGYLAKHEVMG